jgi:hypothetical protein
MSGIPPPVRQRFPLSNAVGEQGGVAWFQVVRAGTGLAWTLIPSTETQFVIGLQPRAAATDTTTLQRQLFLAVTAPPTSPPPSSPFVPPPVFLLSYITWHAQGQVLNGDTTVVGISDQFAELVTPHQSQGADLTYVLVRQNPGVYNTFFIDLVDSSGFPSSQGKAIEVDDDGIFGQILRGSDGSDPQINWEVHSWPTDLYPLLNSMLLSTRDIYENASVVFAAQSGYPSVSIQINPSGGGPTDCTLRYPVTSASDPSLETGDLPQQDVFKLEFIDNETFMIRLTPTPPACFWYLQAGKGDPAGDVGTVSATAQNVHARFNDPTFHWRCAPRSGNALTVFDWNAFTRSQTGTLPITLPTRELVNVGLGLTWMFTNTLPPFTLFDQNHVTIAETAPTSPGEEGPFIYMIPVRADDTKVSILSDFLNQPLGLITCCNGSDLSATQIQMCELTQLQAQTVSCDTFITQVCQAQVPNSTLVGCQCFQPPAQNIPGIASQYNVCFDEACWTPGTGAYLTTAIQAVSACPQSVCLLALKTLARSVFYAGTVTSDCLQFSGVIPTVPTFKTPPDNGGNTADPSATFVPYSGFLDYTIMAALGVVLILLVCAIVSLARWGKHRRAIQKLAAATAAAKAANPPAQGGPLMPPTSMIE